MKKRVGIAVVLSAVLLSACGAKPETHEASSSVKTKQSSVKPKRQVAKKQESRAKLTLPDLSGTYYDDSGHTATVSRTSGDNDWQIRYSTDDGQVAAEFTTRWTMREKWKQSVSSLQRDDSYTGFDIKVIYASKSDVMIKMGDGDVNHEMVFTPQRPAQSKSQYDVVLKGDLTPFEGQLTTANLNKAIVDSDFTYGGYVPEDYFSNRTSVFPLINRSDYWDGLSHGSYEVRSDDLPKKVGAYYEVHVHGTNNGSGYRDMTFYLVPPMAKGPDGNKVNEKRVIFRMDNGSLVYKPYQNPNWWQAYR